MIELQNEQLANCLIFDEETFNYSPDGKGPLLSKANLSLLATSLPQRPIYLKFQPPPPHTPSSSLPARCHPGYQHLPAPKDIHNQELDPDSILFVKCSPKIWALGKR